MIIDLGNTDNLLLKSNRTVLLKGLEYLSKIKSENSKNIFYNLTRTTSLKDVDIKFILTFLSKAKYIEYNYDKITRKLRFDSNIVIEELILFYYSVLANNEQLNTAIFVKSKFVIIDDEISIDIFSVQIRYRIFFTILQNLGLLIKTDKKGVVIIKNYSLAKKFLSRPLKKISPEEFEKDQEQKKYHGIEAERFVLAFERKRLENKQIEWVAEYIVNEGYDIASYNEKNDEKYNRFIEVKSYDGAYPYFYWSRNEVDVARRKSNNYWIYLVNRKEMNKENYVPIMKQNPIENIMDDEKWDKQIEIYKIVYKGQN
tara:strand:+ start:7865 stop:8806 length:942 start_codon:yes stop_codon:yes gene_type:complete